MTLRARTQHAYMHWVERAATFSAQSSTLLRLAANRCDNCEGIVDCLPTCALRAERPAMHAGAQSLARESRECTDRARTCGAVLAQIERGERCAVCGESMERARGEATRCARCAS